MSSSTLSFTKAKEIAINFVKKHKDALRDSTNGRPVSDSDIAHYEKMTPFEFFDEARIQADFGSQFYLFDVRWTSNSKQAQIWMGEHTSINDLNKKIAKNSISDESLRQFWQTDGTWYNFTEARLEALGKILDQLGAKPTVTTAKKSSKKPAKKAAPKKDTIEISDVVTIKNDVAFIDSENDKFDHLMHMGGKNVDVYVNNKSELNASNQIDHVINAFKVAKKEIDAFISELVAAKEHGAKNVVDADWCAAKNFSFDS